MKRRKLKVFHGLVNYGTQAGVFAKELRSRGVDALSVTYPDSFSRLIDVELLYGGNFFQKVARHFWNVIRRLYWFFKYNTFHFYFGSTLFRDQLDLPFYRIFGKKVVMEYLGYDVQLYQYSLDKYEFTNVRFYKSHEVSLKLDVQKQARLEWESKYIDKQLVCAPYLSEFVPISEVLPLAIDLTFFEFSPKRVSDNEIVIMHAPTSRGNKGTSFILKALTQLMDEGFKLRLDLVENVSHDELRKRYVGCDIFIDQILGGWYGTASVEAMAIGRPTVCFIREDYFKYINYGYEIPIINASPKNLIDILRETIINKDKLSEIGEKSRRFVEKIHDVKINANKLIHIYNNL